MQLLLLLAVTLVSPTWLDKKVEELDEEELEEKVKEVEEKAEVLGLVILSTRMEDLTPERLRSEGELVEEWVVEDRWKGKVCQGLNERHMVIAFTLETEGVRERREAELVEADPPIVKKLIANTEDEGMVATVTLWAELNCMDGEEDALIEAIRKEFLHTPSTEGYNRSSSSSFSSSS